MLQTGEVALLKKKTKTISRTLLTLLGVWVHCHLTINLFPVLNYHPDYFLLVMTMPYDISASDPWADDDWIYNPTEWIKASKKWMAIGITDAQLMLVHRLLPDYEQHIKELKSKSKNAQNEALNQWWKTATEAMLKHSLFNNLIRNASLRAEDQVKKYHNIASICAINLSCIPSTNISLANYQEVPEPQESEDWQERA